MDEAVEPIGYLTISQTNHSHTTYAITLIICRFKVYCCKIIHTFFRYIDKGTTKKRYTKFFFPVQFLIFETSAAK